tara:strand:+ start:34249 stop:34464 length:216 start_codon:yes stop_codon:yes gene_type:complete
MSRSTSEQELVALADVLNNVKRLPESSPIKKQLFDMIDPRTIELADEMPAKEFVDFVVSEREWKKKRSFTG